MLVQVGKKRKMEPVETVIVCGQQNFELQNQLNPVGIKIGDDQIINLLRHIVSIYTDWFFISVVSNKGYSSNICYMS